jgi:hypothetical protein
MSIGNCPLCGKPIHWGKFVINEKWSHRGKDPCASCRQKRARAEKKKAGVVSVLWPRKVRAKK